MMAESRSGWTPTARSGSTACSELVGSWTTSGAQLRLPDLVTEDRACPDELRAQDELELAVLVGGPTVEITADRLTLTGPFGAGLSYRDDAGGLTPTRSCPAACW